MSFQAFQTENVSPNFIENEDFVTAIRILNPTFVLPSKEAISKLMDEKSCRKMDDTISEEESEDVSFIDNIYNLLEN